MVEQKVEIIIVSKMFKMPKNAPKTSHMSPTPSHHTHHEI